MQGFWIYHSSEYASGSENTSFEYPKATQGFEYAWIIPEYSWISLNMTEYTGLCVKNMPRSAWMAFVLCFLIAVSCLLECVVTYFNVCMKLEGTWRNMGLFSLRDKI